MHKLLAKQLARVRKTTGEVDVDELLALVSEAYAENDRDRRRTDRSISLTVEELDARHRDLSASERDLTFQNRHFIDALDNMGHGLSMYDAEARLVVCNRKFVELFQMQDLDPRPGMPFETIARFQTERGLYRTPLDVAELSRAEANFGQRVRELTDGRILLVTRSRRPAGGWVSVFEDITERRRLEQERELAAAEAVHLREQERAAEAGNQAKSEFLAAMSHEIRTPMNAVLGLAATLLETQLDAAQRDSVEAIQGAGSNLLRLLNDILDLSKLEAGRMEFESAPFAPADLLGSIFGIVRISAASKGLRMRAEIDPGVPPALVGDAGRLRQVLLNLATNAVKFTEHGEIVVGVRRIAGEDGRTAVEWWVRDTGIGIAPEQAARLFAAYVQADTSIARRFGGTGLGLAICKRIVDQMGGTITVDSRIGAGSTFVVRLALPLGDPADVATPDEPDSVADFRSTLARLGRKLRILIAEDNPTNQLVVMKMLEGLPLSVHVAANGLEAVSSVRQFPPDLIFMDMRMPEMDGLAATRAIRALGGAAAAIPIVALTANAFADDVKACREAGMTDFVAKPVRKDVLLGKIAQVARTGTVAGGAKPPEAPQADHPLIDVAVVAALARDIGEDTLRRARNVFMTDAGNRLPRLRRLVGTGDGPGIRAEAHALKGAASAMGFARMRALAADLERRAMDMSPEEQDAAVARLEETLVQLREHALDTLSLAANN
jgi:signal transduction histidine kinase/DNA-binding response OmpR family regulator